MEKEMISFRVDRDIYEELKKRAKLYGVTISDVAREALDVYFKSKIARSLFKAFDPILAVRKLFRDSYGFWGEFDFNKFIRLGRERGLEGDKIWTDEAIREAKPHLEKATQGLLGIPMEDIIERFSLELCVDSKRLQRILLPKKPSKSRKPSKG